MSVGAGPCQAEMIRRGRGMSGGLIRENDQRGCALRRSLVAGDDRGNLLDGRRRRIHRRVA